MFCGIGRNSLIAGLRTLGTGTHKAAVALMVLVCLTAGCRKTPPAQTLVVSAAASFQDVMGELSQSYNETNGSIRIVHNGGASSTLARQILAGAPCDVMLSADDRQLDRLQAAGVIEHRAAIATGRLVVVAHGSAHTIYADFRDLLSATDGLIAIGDAGVPVGEYARGYLKQAGHQAKAASRLVPHRNARHVLATVRAGNADFGFVYETDARGEAGVTIVFTPAATDLPAIIYPAAVLSTGRNRTVARQFVDWLQTAEAGAILRRHGFSPVGR
ncbi:MAG: molybdate transport system substrate-binding protein [Myxococcota bacterium]